MSVCVEYSLYQQGCVFDEVLVGYEVLCVVS